MAYPKECMVVAGLGGTMPTLMKLAIIYTSSTGTPMPESGVYFGLLLFFIVGAGLGYVLKEEDLKRAFIIGIAAPGIITNMISGASEAKIKLGWFDPIPAAFAEQSTGKRTITMEAFLDGQNKAANIDFDFLVAARHSNMQERVLGLFSTAQDTSNTSGVKKDNTIMIDSDVTDIIVYAKDFKSTVKIPAQSFKTAKLALILKVEKGNDFLWSLGAKRSYKILGMTSELRDINK